LSVNLNRLASDRHQLLSDVGSNLSIGCACHGQLRQLSKAYFCFRKPSGHLKFLYFTAFGFVRLGFGSFTSRGSSGIIGDQMPRMWQW